MDKQTTAQPEAHISLNPAGYLEMVFHGVVYHATLQAMVEQATALAAEHGLIFPQFYGDIVKTVCCL